MINLNRRLNTCLLALTLAAAPLCVAATAAQAAAQTQTQAQAQDAGFARRMVLARQIIDLVGTKTMLNNMLKGMTDLMNMALKGDPNLAQLPQADQEKLSQFMIEELGTTFSVDLVEAYATEYANAFSEDELNQLVAVYKTPIMQKSVAVNMGLQEKMKTQGEVLGRQAGQRAAQRWVKWRGEQGN